MVRILAMLSCTLVACPVVAQETTPMTRVPAPPPPKVTGSNPAVGAKAKALEWTLGKAATVGDRNMILARADEMAQELREHVATGETLVLEISTLVSPEGVTTIDTIRWDSGRCPKEAVWNLHHAPEDRMWAREQEGSRMQSRGRMLYVEYYRFPDQLLRSDWHYANRVGSPAAGAMSDKKPVCGDLQFRSILFMADYRIGEPQGACITRVKVTAHGAGFSWIEPWPSNACDQVVSYGAWELLPRSVIEDEALMRAIAREVLGLNRLAEDAVSQE